MATLALFAVGSAVGSYAFGTAAIYGVAAASITATAFAAVGSYIDATYLMPALFNADSASFRGARLSDLQLQTGTEGTGIKRVYGEDNYVAGTVVWMSDLIEEEKTESVGGGKGGGGGGSSTTYSYFVSLAVVVCEGEIEEIERIKADSKTIYSDGVAGHRATSITVYPGDETQDPDPIMESYEGVGNVPAYRGRCVVVIEKLALADFGNRVPNLRFKVRKTTNATVAETIGELLENHGLTTDDYDVSDVASAEMRGYVLDGPTNAVEAIEPLMLTFNIGAQDRDGKLSFFQRGVEDEIVVPSQHLAASDSNAGEKPRPITLTDVSGYDLPSEVAVRFVDTSIGLQQGSQRAKRLAPSQRNVVALDLPVTMSPTAARKIAERYLWTSWAERTSASIELPPRYFTVREGDRLSVSEAGETYVMRVASIARGANMVHRVSGIVTETSTYDPDAAGEDGEYVDPELYTPPELASAFFDGPALRETDIYTPGVYAFACALDPAAEWLGASVFTSVDNVAFAVSSPLPVEAKLGECATTLGGDEVSTYVWDEANTVDVEFFHGVPSNATADQVYAGSNWCRIGAEILAYKTATLVAGTTYRLSGLLRGLRDTFSAAATHGATEQFTQLTTVSGTMIPYASGAVGLDRYYKAVPVGEDETAVAETTLTLGAGNCRPFAPTALDATLASGDWTIEWVRVTRAFVRLFSEVVVPNEETFEQYLVEILDVSSNVVREITVDDATTTVYTSAMQTADFGSPQTTLRVRVRQMGAIAGRGNPTSGAFS